MQAGDDNALLRDYVENRSDEAFAALVAKHLNLVYSVALRCIGNAHHAEEISQAVFIVFARKASQLRHHRALSSWLFQTTRLTANNFRRTEIRRQRREQEAYMQSTLNEPTEAPTVSPLLDTAVAALGETDRRAIVLRFYEGRNLRDVGVALGASEAAAEKRVARAVEKLRVFLGKRGVALSAAAIAAAASANSAHAAPAGLAKVISTVAAAKGATASASSAAIAQGALKVMAWANLKLAVVVSMGVLLAAAGGTELYQLSQNSSAEGTHVSRSDWKPSGSATPEAALKTMLYGKSIGEYQALKAWAIPALAEDMEHDFLKNMTGAEKSAWAIASIKTLKGYSIRKWKTLPDGQVVMRLGFDGQPKTDYSFETYTNIGGEWKCSSVEERSAQYFFRFPSLKTADFAPRAGSDLQGFWTGTITTPHGELHHYAKIAELNAGAYYADFYTINPGNVRQATLVDYHGTKVKLLPMGGLHGMFEGTLPKGGTEMTGKWIQYGRVMPATFKRTN